MRNIIITIIILVTVIFSSCSYNQKNQKNSIDKKHELMDDEDHNHSDGDHHGHEKGIGHKNEIEFSKEQAKMVGITTENVIPGIFTQVIKTSGQIMPAQGDEITIVASTNGIVSFTKSSLVEGIAVRAGESLVSITAKEILDGDPFMKSKMIFETAQNEFQRAEKLIVDKIISIKDYEQIKLKYETAKSAYESQSSNYTAKGVKVKSPISGFLKNKLVNQGEYITVGQPIAIVSQNRKLNLRADVSENQYRNLKNIISANFKPSYENTLYKLKDLNGHLVSFGKSSGENSVYIPIIFEFDNIGDILPGSFTEIYLLSNTLKNIISVPVSCVTEEEGLYFVYLKLDETTYKKQEVILGQDNGDRIQIISGLKKGDKLVIKGVYQLKLAGNSSVIPEGHTH
jgi:membrane fusion protein, heavy metal efflux system